MSEENVKSLKDIIKEEYKKCLESPAYFMRRYCMIEHQQRGQIPFNLFRFQEKTLNEFRDHRFNIVLKARQMGISTLTAGYALWMMTFQESKTILVIATTQNTAKNLVTKVRFMHERLPRWLRVQEIEDNKLSLKLKNGSQVIAVSSESDAARSYALSLLILDEAAFIDKAEEIWTSSIPTLSTGGNAIILSTPNGIGNFFHKMWVEAETGLNEFNTIKLKWDLHPEHDQAWRDLQTKISGPKAAAQECDTDFLSSGNTVVETETITFFKDTHLKEPIEKRWVDRNYWMWQLPDYSKSYLVAADVARGDGSDFSAFHVIDVETVEQVAEYKGQLPTKEFGNLLVEVATQYNNALLVIENNTIGWSAIQPVIDRQYPNLFYTSADLQYVDVEHQMSNRINRDEKKMTPGFAMTTRTRPLIISKLESYFRERTVTPHSIRLIEELYVFIWNGGKAEATRGYNDDLVMSLGIALWVRDTAFRLRQEGVAIQKTIIERIGKIDNSPAPIYTSTGNQNNPWKMQLGNRQEDLRWLL